MLPCTTVIVSIAIYLTISPYLSIHRSLLLTVSYISSLELMVSLRISYAICVFLAAMLYHPISLLVNSGQQLPLGFPVDLFDYFHFETHYGSSGEDKLAVRAPTAPTTVIIMNWPANSNTGGYNKSVLETAGLSLLQG
jgi:hypothetical protein